MAKQKKIRILSEEEAQNLIENIPFPEYQLLTKITLNHGLRNSEAISLKRKDFNLENQSLWVIEGKRGKDRELPIHSDIVDELEEYLEGMDDEDYLFPSPVIDSHISSRFFQKLIRRASVNAGLYPETVEKPEDVTLQIPYHERVTPHTLRHTFSVRLLRNDTPIQEVSKLLGHESVEITIESYDFLDIETGRTHMNEVSFA
ncbi:tyrosine-type recombinase/integrase [Candidatus Nanohalococcus occultus]|uniref:tyrosine-type recombinase/integrase n=1 Tax=Candidatus Nanohalococcus occultus TaxID=2978047 RepID=UPI0039E1C52E